MTGLVAAIQRQQGRAQALQAQCLRMAAWVEAEDFGRLMEQLNGPSCRPRQNGHRERDAALAGFGLRAE